jgi:myo-inositol-1(or 4)-monophosphatase
VGDRPLDGTTNFIHGFPVYCVSIALLVRGRVEQAVVYDPTRNDLFTATRGRGAYRQRPPPAREQAHPAEGVAGLHRLPVPPGRQLQRLPAHRWPTSWKRTAGLRRPGAAALDLAYVAAGYTEGFFETGLSPWDVAAGSLLVTEAGGLIGNFTGEADFLEQREVVRGHPRIYGQLVKLLSKYSKFASAGEKAEVRQNTPQVVEPALEAGIQADDPPPRPCRRNPRANERAVADALDRHRAVRARGRRGRGRRATPGADRASATFHGHPLVHSALQATERAGAAAFPALRCCSCGRSLRPTSRSCRSCGR